MPARVVVVHSSDELYGADRMLLQVLAAMREQPEVDLEIEVWLPSDVEHGEFPLCSRLAELDYRYEHRRIPILRRDAVRPVGVARLLRDAWMTQRELRRRRPDLVFLGSSACLLVGPLARLAGTRRCVVHLQERWSGRTGSVLRFLARWTTARIAISSFVADASGLTDPAPVVIANCVDDPLARDSGAPEATEPGDHDGALRFIVASRWNRWKGHRTLFAAWDRAGCPGELTVVGGPPPSGERVDVAALATGLDDPASVDILGEVDDIAPSLARADVLVLPSDDPEPFGLVVIEAFALGRPAVASGAGGPIEIIDDGETGWFFAPRDVAALADLLVRLTPADVRRAGRAARRVYEERYHPAAYRRLVGEVVAGQVD